MMRLHSPETGGLCVSGSVRQALSAQPSTQLLIQSSRCLPPDRSPPCTLNFLHSALQTSLAPYQVMHASCLNPASLCLLAILHTILAVLQIFLPTTFFAPDEKKSHGKKSRKNQSKPRVDGGGSGLQDPHQAHPTSRTPLSPPSPDFLSLARPHSHSHHLVSLRRGKSLLDGYRTRCTPARRQMHSNSINNCAMSWTVGHRLQG
jgi:hypothetical protein